MTIDPPTKAVADMIADLGLAVTIQETQATATDNKTGERFVVRGDYPHRNVCQLAEQVGSRLEDGRAEAKVPETARFEHIRDENTTR